MYLPILRNNVYVVVFVANFIQLIAGTALTWSSSVLPKLSGVDLSESPFDTPITPEQASWISSLVTLGAVVGPFIFSFLADKIGRKPTLLYLAIPYLFCYLLLAFGSNVEVYYVARFISGVAVGGVFTILPIYIGEISEPTNRGALSSSMGCFCCLGLLISCSLGAFINIKIFNIILAIFPVIFLVLFSVLCTETPAYLMQQGDEKLARAALEKLRTDKSAVERDMVELQSIDKETHCAAWFELFRVKSSRRAVITTIGLMTFQQFSGINGVLFNSTKIFQQTGTKLAPEYCSIIVVGMQFLSSFFTPFLVDKWGRRIVLLLSGIGMVLSEIPLGVFCILKKYEIDVDALSFLPIITLTTFILFFNLGFGPIPWVMLSELFSPKVKSLASALVSTFVWMLSFIVTKYFERIVKIFGLGELFLFFAFCCSIASIFSMLYVIETKGRTFPEIQEQLMR